MTLLSEKASRGNSKALGNIYLTCRGLVRWIWTLLSDEKITEKEERKIWRSFYDAVGNGAITEGDQVENFLTAAAAAVFCGKDADIAVRKGTPVISMIKFPGDMDAGKKYLRQLFSSVGTEVRASALLCASGVSAESASEILGVSAEEASSSLNGAADALKESAKGISAGKYNINIPTPEMFGDLISRASATADSDGDADSEILSYADAAAASINAASKKKEPESGEGNRKKLRIAALLAAAVLIIGSVGVYFITKGRTEQDGGTGTYDGPVSGKTDTDDTEMFANYHVVMEIKDYGTIELELDSKAAPRTVKNFVDLARSGFYDGLTFHRIMEGFMIQGGDPDGNGSGGSKRKILGEFAANGIENPISHTRGTISMARAPRDYNSARSQFFIVQQDSTYLDGEYAAFGHVISGMDVVDRIAADAKPIDDNGTIPADEQPVILSVTVSVISDEEQE